MQDGAATRWIHQYHRDGYYAPLPALSPEEARACRARLEAFEAERGALRDDLRHHAHVFLVWLDVLVRNARILDAVEAILGENLLVWSSSLFIKEGGDGTHVPWHQDSRAFGRRAASVLTAWVALTDSTTENGAMEVLPGSHRRGDLPHVTQQARDSLLTRRPEAVPGVDGTAAVPIPLRAGEMSLHHSSLVHGSQPNRTGGRRIGIAIRYVRPDGGRPDGRRQPALLVRGVDAAGAFVPLPRPERDASPEGLARHADLMRRPHPGVRIGADGWPRTVTLGGALLSRDGLGLLLCGPPGPEMRALAGGLARRGWITADGGPGDDNASGVARPGRPGREAPDRVPLAAILLLGESQAAGGGLPPAALLPAHAILALLPHRMGADRMDLAAGVRALEPLATAVPVLECASARDGTVGAVERLAANAAAEPSPSDARRSRVWARPGATAATGSSKEAMHD